MKDTSNMKDTSTNLQLPPQPKCKTLQDWLDLQQEIKKALNKSKE